MRAVVGVVLLALVAWGLLAVVGFWIRLKYPPRIPAALAFEREIRSKRGLREVAELLAKRFSGPTDGVVCLGLVRGNAARVLFHSGPENRGRNRNLYRSDYLLEVVRDGRSKMLLRLALNRPYSYLRLRTSEMEPLVRALQETYGGIDEI